MVHYGKSLSVVDGADNSCTIRQARHELRGTDDSNGFDNNEYA
jgi:hypothetical protein